MFQCYTLLAACEPHSSSGRVRVVDNYQFVSRLVDLLEIPFPNYRYLSVALQHGWHNSATRVRRSVCALPSAYCDPPTRLDALPSAARAFKRCPRARAFNIVLISSFNSDSSSLIAISVVRRQFEMVSWHDAHRPVRCLSLYIADLFRSCPTLIIESETKVQLIPVN